MTVKGTIQYKIPSVPIFRKLFRKGPIFVCGICRSEYQSRVDGNNCLNFCWFELKNLNPVFILRDPQRGWLYRCQFCARDHASEAAAKLCAHNCSEKQNHIHIQEQLLNDLPLSDHRPQPLILVRSLKELVARTAKAPRKKRKKHRKNVLPIIELPRNDETPPTLLHAIEPAAQEQRTTHHSPLDDSDEGIDLIVHANKEVSQEEPRRAHDHSQNDSQHSSWSLSPIGYRCRICHSIYDHQSEAEACHARHGGHEHSVEINLDA